MFTRAFNERALLAGWASHAAALHERHTVRFDVLDLEMDILVYVT
jgi:hypothetical protein